MRMQFRLAACAALAMIWTASALAAPVEVKGFKVTAKVWKVGEAKGKTYLDVQFLGTVTDTVDPKAMMQVKAECKVGSAELVDDAMVFGSTKLKEMKSGQSTKLNALLYGIRNALDATPSRCTLTVTSSVGFGAKKQSTALATVCWNGKAVQDGACK